jgi:hypothetical protein
MEETVTLTLRNDNNIDNNKFADYCDEIWSKFCTYYSSNGKYVFDEYEKEHKVVKEDGTTTTHNNDEDYYSKNSLQKRCKARRAKKNPLPPPDTVRTAETWHSYHANMLRLAYYYPDIVFQIDVLHPQTNLKFRSYYANALHCLCDTVDEEFDKTKLI